MEICLPLGSLGSQPSLSLPDHAPDRHSCSAPWCERSDSPQRSRHAFAQNRWVESSVERNAEDRTSSTPLTRTRRYSPSTSPYPPPISSASHIRLEDNGTVASLCHCTSSKSDSSGTTVLPAPTGGFLANSSTAHSDFILTPPPQELHCCPRDGDLHFNFNYSMSSGNNPALWMSSVSASSPFSSVIDEAVPLSPRPRPRVLPDEQKGISLQLTDCQSPFPTLLSTPPMYPLGHWASRDHDRQSCLDLSRRCPQRRSSESSRSGSKEDHGYGCKENRDICDEHDSTECSTQDRLKQGNDCEGNCPSRSGTAHGPRESNRQETDKEPSTSSRMALSVPEEVHHAPPESPRLCHISDSFEDEIENRIEEDDDLFDSDTIYLYDPHDYATMLPSAVTRRNDSRTITMAYNVPPSNPPGLGHRKSPPPTLTRDSIRKLEASRYRHSLTLRGVRYPGHPPSPLGPNWERYHGKR
ncbi:hypothetical protein K439DRAFT_1658151 [Ramaria rubella]|nr:hypothetical protein K439DRAFT_1658151 [Ramaria rubella]